MESITSLYVPMAEGTIDGWSSKGFDATDILTQKDRDSGLAFANLELVQRRVA
jgi:hypothetical protein